MSSPGWYPDPAGAPNLERWWDGRQWTPSTRMPPPPAPPGVAGGPSWPELPAQPTQPWGQPSPPPRRRTGLVVGVVALVVALVVGGGVAAFLLTGSEDDVVTSPTPSPSVSSSATDKILSACPEHERKMTTGRGDRVRGGGMSFPLPKDYSYVRGDDVYGFPFPWGVDYQLVTKPLVDTWVSLIVIGRLPTQGGYTSLKQSAESLINCIIRSRKWFHYDSVAPEVSEAREIDGQDAWVATMRVDLAEAPFEEDLLTVVVVDTGTEGEYAVLVADAPSDAAYAAEQEAITAAVDGLRVD